MFDFILIVPGRACMAPIRIFSSFFFNAVFHNTVTITIFTEINDDNYWGQDIKHSGNSIRVNLDEILTHPAGKVSRTPTFPVHTLFFPVYCKFKRSQKAGISGTFPDCRKLKRFTSCWHSTDQKNTVLRYISSIWRHVN